jgi:indole-3-glycerol phosphate synthase
MSILDEIFTYKRHEVALAIQALPLADLQTAAIHMSPALDFTGALADARSRNAFPALIAEIKAASPSRGVLLPDFDPLRLAQVYAENGAAAVSVLTDQRYFKGHLDYLRQVRTQYPHLPLLRKDFIYHPYQVYEARLAGADAILLIVAGLEAAQLVELQTLTRRLGMAALVEVHTQAELETALTCQANLIGINNRDLHTFQTSLETTLRLLPLVPPGVVVVAESGIREPADIALLGQQGITAVLVGEALVTAADIAEKVRSFSNQAALPMPQAIPKIKFMES